MKTIIKNTQSIPGLKNLYAIPASHIKEIVAEQNRGALITDNLVLKETADMYSFQSALDSETLMVRSVKSNAGTYYNGRFVCFIAGLSQVNHQTLCDMKQHTYILVYQDYMGKLKCFGDKDIGLNFEFIERSSPRHGYEIIFSGDAVNPPININIVTQPDNPDWDFEVDPNYILQLEKYPDAGYVNVFAQQAFADQSGNYNYNSYVVETSISPAMLPIGFTYSFVGWEVVSGTTPEGFNPNANSLFITLLSNCTIKAIWSIHKPS